MRNAAWQCLLDYQVGALPVNPLDIAQIAGIKVVKNSESGLLSGGETGTGLYDGNQWYLIYDDESTLGRRRFTVAHELGHIFLGHQHKSMLHKHKDGQRKPPAETEADSFAYRLLAPACVLWGLKLHTAEEIAAACSITITAARARADRMRVLYRREKFLTSPLEKKVYHQFEDYINRTLSSR